MVFDISVGWSGNARYNAALDVTPTDEHPDTHTTMYRIGIASALQYIGMVATGMWIATVTRHAMTGMFDGIKMRLIFMNGRYGMNIGELIHELEKYDKTREIITISGDVTYCLSKVVPWEVVNENPDESPVELHFDGLTD